MPKKFEDCVSVGNKVRTIKPSKTKYQHICIKKGGKTVAGEVKTTKIIAPKT